MQGLEWLSISCPYCGEQLDISVDCSVEYQQYIEDCQVCCRPMQLSVSVDGQGNASVHAEHEDN